MNVFTLVCKLKTLPELRYTPIDQRPITTFGIDFPDPNPEKSETFPLRVTLFGKGAESVVNMGLVVGEPLLIEGRLTMNIVDRPEGFKEKRGEVICSKLQRLQLGNAPAPAPSPQGTQPQSAPNPVPVNPPVAQPQPQPVQQTPPPAAPPVTTVDPLADIPF